MSLRRWLAVVVATLTMTLATAPSAAASSAGESLWRAEEWTDFEGRTWTAEDLAGRVVLLDFWATWCAPCLAELPHLRDLHERYGDRGLVIIGVALDAIERRDLRSFLLRHDVDWPQVHERDGTGAAFAQRFAVEAVPVTVLVDREGRMIARDLRGKALAKVIGTLLPGDASR